MTTDTLSKMQKLVGDSSYEILQQFDTKFSAQIGRGQAVSFSAGRMGFYALMNILNIGKGDEVILQGHTCSVMPNAVWRSGATPVFADIDPDTFGSSASKIEKVLTQKTKMIVAQHSFGIPCNIKPIVDLAHSKGIFLLEDCAITLGSKINDVSIGNFGDAALFSIDHSKPLNGLIGGLIYTCNKDLYAQLKEIQRYSDDLPVERQEAIWKRFLFERKYYNPFNYGKSLLISKFNRILLRKSGSYFKDDYGKEASTAYPYPAKLPTFLAELGLNELERWKEEKIKRQDLLVSFLKLSTSLGLSDILPPSYFDKDLKIVPLRFVYTHPKASSIKKRISKYIDSSWFWFEKPIVVCKDPTDLGYIQNSCPISEKVGREIINWPCVFNKSDNEQLLKYFKMVHA